MNLHEIMLAKQLAGANGGGNIDLSDYYTKSQTDGLISAKVDKESGKSLSTNDFTDADKSKLDGLENYDDTNVKADVAESASQAAINRSTLGYQRKNLLKNTAKTQTTNGITFTVNSDGSVTVNGTANNTVSFAICTLNDLEVGKKYTLSGCPNGGNSNNTYRLYGLDTKQWEFAGSDVGNGSTFPVVRNPCVFRIAIYSGYTAENLTFFPMLRYAEITDDTYEPYKPSVTEYIANLEERIAVLESVNLTANSLNSSMNTTEINVTEEEFNND